MWEDEPDDFAEVLAEAERLIHVKLPPPQITWTHRVRRDADWGAAPAERTWQVNLRPWLANDAAYPPFWAGAVMEFALELEPLATEPAAPGTPHAVHLGDGIYGVLARVVRRTDDLCVLDFGVLALQTWLRPEDAPPEWVREGAYIRGDIVVSVDAGSYLDWHGDDPQMPAMIYRWRIGRITAETTPRIPASAKDRARCGSPEMETNDPLRRTFTSVAEARPRGDWPAGEMLHYYLTAERLSGNAIRSADRTASHDRDRPSGRDSAA